MSATGQAQPKKNRVGTAVRILAPVVPLAIALAHQALTPKNGAREQPAAHAVVERKSAGAASLSPPSLSGCVTKKPCPLLAKGKPAVSWWFVFKFNAQSFPGCNGTNKCPFGGDPQTYKIGQHYVVATSDAPKLADGAGGCLGATIDDPVGASFDEVYNGDFHYVIWNDQPYGDPKIAGCSGSGGNCEAPWAHSKGMLAWNDAGEGFVMQVSTPSWPISGSVNIERQSGNTLGCFKGPDNVLLSQHFFALLLSKADVVTVLRGLANAGVATDNSDGSMMINNGGPTDIQSLVSSLGTEPDKTTRHVVEAALSSGVTFLSKSSGMDVPSWQFVSAELGGSNLRVATFYSTDRIESTAQAGKPTCWDTSLGVPGAVENAKTGSWPDPSTRQKVIFDFGSSPSNGNHAKIGVTTSGKPMAIFGDENQQGGLGPVGPLGCAAAQNGRGGTFYALQDPQLAASLGQLMAGDSF
jgi:hypothetical protein